jgi:hypothetical protein
MSDVGNPIRFENLFDKNVSEGLEGLIDKIGEVESALMGMLKQVKTEAKLAGEALAGTTSSTKGDRDATSQYAAEIERLHAENKKLVKSLDSVQKQLKNMKDAKNKDKNETINLSQSYESLADLIKETGVNVEELLKSDRQLSIAKKNGETANGSLAGSYNKLYAQYNLVKNVLNAMGEEMRNNEAVGKKWEAQALSLMNTMKGMQEATGKHTLSVGDYTKAFNGLNIATQQVLREMPTLANSLSQFFIAISNNVPIFVDNFKRVQQETGSWQMAMKGVLTSVFSWQTALLVVLTILPKIAKAIHDKKKAQEEDNLATKKQIEYLHLVHEALLASAKAETKNISKIRTLVAVINDHNRAEQERINAAQVLKETYEEQLGNYTAEEIALGKAKTTLDEITKSLVEQAKARAVLNKITEAYEGQIEAEDKMETAGQTKVYEYDLQNVKGLYEYIENKVKTTGMSEEYIRKQIALVEKDAKNIWAQYEAYKQAKKEIGEYGKTIEDLTKRIPVAGLLESTKKQLDKSKDYYWQWRESVANIMEDEEERALELNNIKYEHAIANMQKELDAQKAAGTLTIEQEKYMTDIITNLETERQQKRWEIIWDFYKKYWNSIKDQYNVVVEETPVDEEDLSISGQYEKVLAENAKKLMASRERLNTALEQGSYREAKAEGKAFKDLTIEKLKLEEELQEALLKMRLDTGTITADQYEIELAKLQTTLAKNIANLSKKRRGKFNLATLLFGETKEDGKGNVYKELSAEAQAFVGAFEQAMSSAFEYMDEWMDKRIEMAEVAVEAAEKESEAAKTALDYEMEARANGYANNVELARKEYEEKLQLEKDAIAEKERLEKIQEGIDSATQMSSLITATANLLAGYSGIPLVGQILAAAAIATMWGTFAAAKVTAAQMTATKYGEGMSEYLDYGGSHASGHDIDFGADKNGRRRRVERGEMIGVINKRNVEKYGVSRITDIIQSLNKGTFEKKYTKEDEIRREVLMRNLANERNITNESNVDDWLEKRMEMSEIAVEKASMVDKAMKDGIASYDENSTDMARLLRGLLGRKAVQTPTSSQTTRKERAIPSSQTILKERVVPSSQTILKESIIKYVQPPLADIIFPSMNTDLYRNAFSGLKDGGINLEGVENKLQTLIEQGEVRVVTTPYGRIEYKGNNKRIIHNS